MAIKIFWSKRAEQGYADIVRYLEEEWTEKEVRKFVVETTHFFELLKIHPYLLEPSQSNKNLCHGPINKLTLVTYLYKPRKKEIILVNVRSTRRKPSK